MGHAYLIDVVRTASGRGKAGGQLAGMHPVDLFAAVLGRIAERNGIPTERIDDVIGGCLTQSGKQAVNITRNAILAAGFPVIVPGTTVDRQCGSSQQATAFAAQGVMAGFYDVVIAGGVESMSSNPLNSALQGHDPWGEGISRRFPGGLVGQGISAELVASRWGLSRDALDEYSVRSHRLAAEADPSREIVPILVDGHIVDKDQTVRPGTTLEGLAGLKPSFRTEEYAARFPEIDWKITPGNSSPLTDGASAALIVSERAVRELGLVPRARFHSFSIVGSDPIEMLTGIIPATGKVLDRAGLGINDIDVFEVNEAFASVTLAWLKEFVADPEKLNPRGGAIALGHAIGSSGTRLLGTLLNQLEQTHGRYGLQTMCEGQGMSNATIIERL
jgi:acetyl-CoA acyltransferase